MNMVLCQSELTMWHDEVDEKPEKSDDRAINERYIRGEGRIVIETNREKLPGFVSLLGIFINLRRENTTAADSFKRNPKAADSRK